MAAKPSPGPPHLTLITTQLDPDFAAIHALANAGDVPAARAQLASLVQNQRAYLATDYFALDRTVFAAFFVQHLPSAERAIDDFFRSREPTRLVTASPPESGGPGAVLWRFAHGHGSTFVFDHELFTLEPGHAYTIINRWLSFMYVARAYADEGRPNGAAFVEFGDWGGGLGLTYCDNHPHPFLIPDHSFIINNAYQGTRKLYADNPCPWHERQPTAIWRGSSTGLSATGLMDIPRIRLCQLAADPQSQGLLDAGLTAIVQAASPEEIEAVNQSGLTRPYVGVETFNRYKFQIDIDGNSNSWPGLFQKLLTGSPVLKVDSPGKYRQWYYDRLVPWRNFIPIRSDMTDLVPTLRFLAANDAIAEQIGRRGLALANELRLQPELKRSLDTVEAAFNAHRFRNP